MLIIMAYFVEFKTKGSNPCDTEAFPTKPNVLHGLMAL